MCRLKPFLVLLICSFCLFSSSAQAAEFVLNGLQFSPLSKNVCRSGQQEARLLSMGSSAYAIYEFRVPASLKTFSASAEIRNPRRQKVDIYVWNYGSRQESDLLSKEDIDLHWIRWESCLVDSQWQSRSPEYLSVSSGSGIVDFVGDYRVIKVMFYADKGFPPDTDELFFIRRVTLQPSGYDELFSRVEELGNSVWIEGDLLVAEGIGYPARTQVSRAPSRIMAERAGFLIAYRNLAMAMDESNDGSHVRGVNSLVRGAQKRLVENLPDGGVRVVVEMPLKEALRRRQELSP